MQDISTMRNARTTVVIPVTVDFSQYSDNFFTPEQLEVLNRRLPTDELTENEESILRDCVFGFAEEIISSGYVQWLITESDVPQIVD